MLSTRNSISSFPAERKMLMSGNETRNHLHTYFIYACHL